MSLWLVFRRQALAAVLGLATALDAGDVEGNSDQRLPFLESQSKVHGYKIGYLG